MEKLSNFLTYTLIVIFINLVLITLQNNPGFGNENYSLIKQFGTKGNNESQFHEPIGIAIDKKDNSIYVADTSNHRIQKFDVNGNFVLEWGMQGKGDGQFNGPRGIDIDSKGDIYVSDFDNNRIHKFSAFKTCPTNHKISEKICLITNWGSTGSENGKFRVPYDLAVDSQDNIYVADLLNHRIQKFDSSGKFIEAWNLNSTNPSKTPLGIGIDKINDTLYISTGKDIQKFDSSGKFIEAWNLNRSANVLFQGITVDLNGYVYVTDIQSPTIQKFDSSGKFIEAWNLHETDLIQKPGSSDIAIDSLNNTIISNTKNNNIQIFRQSG
jgi:DNA-binding beta-propeller fold protein YncE